jgi:hypothetical protein
MDSRHPGKLEVAATLITTLIAAWYMIPERDRQLARLRALHLLHQASARLALREGHRGMGDELAGRDLQRYGIAYLLSQARDGLGQVLEDMRP